MKKDDILNLVDIPGIKVHEDGNHNLILTFSERVVYEPGDTITVWSSEIYQKGQADK